MSALDDFIAQDYTRDFVDLYGDVRWTEAGVRAQTEQVLVAVGFDREYQRILSRIADIYTIRRQNVIMQALSIPLDADMVLPEYDLSVAEKQALSAYGTASVLCGALKDMMWARAQLVNGALDYENARAWRDSLPPVEEGQPDPDADLRAQLQAMMDQATQPVLDTVALRDARRAEQNPPQ